MHQSSPRAAVLLWGRAAIVATLTVYLGTTAHVSADGLVPGAPGLVLLTVVAVLVCAGFLRGQASARRLVALLAAGQAGVHVVLTAAAGHGGALTDLPHHHAAHLTGSNALMALAHLSAATLVGLWLAVGERALWELVQLAAGPVHRGQALLRAAGTVTLIGAPPPARPRRFPVGDIPPPHLVLITRDVVRRGPPVLLSS